MKQARAILLYLLFIAGGILYAQPGRDSCIAFDFNEHRIEENNGKVRIKPVGVTLNEDRFGNKNSAVYIHGNSSSYLNLGTSSLLKRKKASISLWINVQVPVYAGKGFTANPFLFTRNGPGEDFIIAYSMGFNYVAKRFGVQCCKDSIIEVIVFSKDTVVYGSWYHMVLSYDNDQLSFYLNGALQGRLAKRFETQFLESDSVIVGRWTGSKNERYSQVIVDDIRFYPRVLGEEEIIALYNEPNPNRNRIILEEVLKYGLIVAVLGMVIVLLMIRNKRVLRKQKEYYELHSKIKELEIKVIKTQMNPHFISNSLAAIQNLIYTSQVDKAALYISKFSSFLRLVLECSDKNYILLEEELTVIKLNLELEQLRFRNNFTVTIRVDESIRTDEVLIPSLITQPFIENAIWHGLLPLQSRDPHLAIEVYPKDERVFIKIEDNGVGRAVSKPGHGKRSRGTALAEDKIASINRLRESQDFRFEIVDLFDEKGGPAGTQVIIQLINYT